MLITEILLDGWESLLKAMLSLPAQNSQIRGLPLRRWSDKCHIVSILSSYYIRKGQTSSPEMITQMSLLLKLPALSSPNLCYLKAQ